MNITFKFKLGDRVRQRETDTIGDVVALQIDASERKWAKVHWIEAGAERNRWIAEAELGKARESGQAEA